MDNAVSIINMSKKFRLYNAPHERLFEAFHPFKKKYHREFWALRDINLEIPKGTTLGIIGRNGSGKSTLLQIICSVLKPTSGEVFIDGRVSALLELGADFHPDFTGSENVIQKGIRMGFTEKEMLSKLPEIEEFADIGEFINQPVKIYSSGMFLRLAFSTAINVDPDILVVDEALAVGDAKFQHKCYQKFTEFQEKGKTIIFVTHNMNAVISHCDRAVLLENGKIILVEEPEIVTNSYLDILFMSNSELLSIEPHLIEQNFKGYNFIHYLKKFYAISISIGEFDLKQSTKDCLASLEAKGECLIGNTREELELLVTEHLANKSKYKGKHSESIISENEFDVFMRTISDDDLCPTRRSYNKNEYRMGDHSAKIIDYFIDIGDKKDVSIISSKDLVSIYFKVISNINIETPNFGFAIKNLEGIVIYGTNSFLSGISVNPIRKGQVAIYKISFRPFIKEGDYFIDLGIGSIIENSPVVSDRRSSIIHIFVSNNRSASFSGYYEMERSFEEIKQTNTIIKRTNI